MSSWHSKKNMSNFRFSWTQPYLIQPIQYSSVGKEMAVIEAIDRLIDSGLTYPGLDSIIKHIANNSRSNPNA
jgi:hypothetical protein